MSQSPFPPTGSQSSVLRRVRATVISAGPPLVLSEQEALTELLRCQDVYALQPQRLADCDLDKLRVTQDGVLPKHFADLVSPSLVEVVRHPCSSMIRSPAEVLRLEESEGPITPYWDPTLRGDPRQRDEPLHKLADSKNLSFRTRARAFAGLFLCEEEGWNDSPHRLCPIS